MPRHVTESWSEYLGPGALSSFLVAVSTAVLGLGLPVAWRLREVLRVAGRDEAEPADAILVLGRSLVDDRPTGVFRARLDHGARLLESGLAPRLVVTGGLTGDATVTEAAAGASYLVASGVPREVILCEDRSRHTLENFSNVRETAREQSWQTLLVVSDPLHLARALTLARGLGLAALGSPAVDAAPHGIAWWFRALRESFLVHWYHCGVVYSRLIRSERNLARVT